LDFGTNKIRVSRDIIFENEGDMPGTVGAHKTEESHDNAIKHGKGKKAGNAGTPPKEKEPIIHDMIEVLPEPRAEPESETDVSGSEDDSENDSGSDSGSDSELDIHGDDDDTIPCDATVEAEPERYVSSKLQLNHALNTIENIVSCKLVFKAKQDASGNVIRFKARLVASCFLQAYGLDSFETYATVAKLTNLRAQLSKEFQMKDLGQFEHFR
jgi:hypothetical protein